MKLSTLLDFDPEQYKVLEELWNTGGLVSLRKSTLCYAGQENIHTGSTPMIHIIFQSVILC